MIIRGTVSEDIVCLITGITKFIRGSVEGLNVITVLNVIKS